MRKGRGGALALALLTAAGCAGASSDPGGPSADPGRADLKVPRLLALSTYDASLGSRIDGYGTGFPRSDEAELYLVFDGTYDTDSGHSETVLEEFRVNVTDSGTFRWPSFGPYGIPFSKSGDEIGVFTGKMSVRAVTKDGDILEDTEGQTEISFLVRPSIRVHEFQPVTASCGAPVLRGIGQLPYRMRVEALGFEPRSFTYSLTPTGTENLVEFESIEPVTVRRAAEGPFDVVDSRALRFPEVPESLKSYGAVVTVTAEGTSGESITSSFGISVHRPMEVFYNGNWEIGQIYPAEPTSGCIYGGPNGRTVTWQEVTSDIRSRAVSISWNQSWMQTHTVERGSARTVGTSEQNGIEFGTANQQEFNWSVGGEAGGLIGPITAKVTAGVGGGALVRQEQDRRREEGTSESTTTTDTEGEADSYNRGESNGAADVVSSLEALSRNFEGEIIANTYGVFYRQATRIMRRAAVVTYNQCGAPNVVGEVDVTDWTWAPDLPLSGSCPPFPEPSLPDPECFVEPCDPVQ